MMAGSALTDDSALEYTFQLLLQLLPANMSEGPVYLALSRCVFASASGAEQPESLPPMRAEHHKVKARAHV